ncbi:MAG: diacylglycerol/lipid kinase family protein [Christensenellales bacterium]
MQRCKLVVNTLSGNADNLKKLGDVESFLKEKYDVNTIFIDENNDVSIKDEAYDCDVLAVCGGDGTLNSAVNAVADKGIDLLYFPCGTLNDTAKNMRLAKKLSKGNRRIRYVDMGKIGDTKFAYVLAGGTFTEIGYATQIKHKKHFKLLAYLFQVFKTYRIHRIKAEIKVNDRIISDEFTLIMAINCSRCFGFRFNKRYVHNDGKAQLLLIKSPPHNGILGKIEIFFPFFKAFFMGLRNETDGKILKFIDFTDAEITVDGSVPFTVDGEKIILTDKNELHILQKDLKLIVY